MPTYTDDRKGLPRPLARPAAMTKVFGAPGESQLVTQTLPIIGKAEVNKACAKAYKQVFAEIERLGLAHLIDRADYGGTYCYRAVRGSTALSPHSWGVAMDLNVSQVRANGKDVRGSGTNYHCSRSQVSSALTELAEVFGRFGFAWGGWWEDRYLDPMHFEATDLTVALLRGDTFSGYDAWRARFPEPKPAVPAPAKPTATIVLPDGRKITAGVTIAPGGAMQLLVGNEQVAVRDIAKALGYTLAWEPKTRTARMR